AARACGGRTGDEQFAGGLHLIRSPEDAGETVQQRRLAGTRGAEQQHPLTGLDDQVETLHGGVAATRVSPPPAARLDLCARRRVRCHGLTASALSTPPAQTSSVRSRPAAKRPSAPVAASARTRSYDTRPASTAPVMIAAIT